MQKKSSFLQAGEPFFKPSDNSNLTNTEQIKAERRKIIEKYSKKISPSFLINKEKIKSLKQTLNFIAQLLSKEKTEKETYIKSKKYKNDLKEEYLDSLGKQKEMMLEEREELLAHIDDDITKVLLEIKTEDLTTLNKVYAELKQRLSLMEASAVKIINKKEADINPEDCATFRFNYNRLIEIERLGSNFIKEETKAEAAIRQLITDVLRSSESTKNVLAAKKAINDSIRYEIKKLITEALNSTSSIESPQSEEKDNNLLKTSIKSLIKEEINSLIQKNPNQEALIQEALNTPMLIKRILYTDEVMSTVLTSKEFIKNAATSKNEKFSELQPFLLAMGFLKDLESYAKLHEELSTLYNNNDKFIQENHPEKSGPSPV